MSTMLQAEGRLDRALFVAGAWMLALVWVLPLAWAAWAAIHPPAFVTRFDPLAPLTAQNFVEAWNAAPFGRYMLKTVMLVTMILAAQLLLCIHAAFAFARLEFPLKNLLFCAGADAADDHPRHPAGAQLRHRGAAGPAG
jgi:sn-glycerol 3-phosphate transport system permease protein